MADVKRNNARLYRAYLLKETLARALDYVQRKAKKTGVKVVSLADLARPGYCTS